MKAGHVKTTKTREEVSLHPGEKGPWIKKRRRNTSYAEEKPGADLKKVLANLWSRKRMGKISQKGYAGRGQETKWEMPIK
jgi:hypothetical protein